MSTFIDLRLAELAARGVTAEGLSEADVRAELATLSERLRTYVEADRFDTSDADRDEVAAWLHARPVDKDDIVVLV